MPHSGPVADVGQKQASFWPAMRRTGPVKSEAGGAGPSAELTVCC